jgi:hypothetical protein
MIARVKARIHDVIYVSITDINTGFRQMTHLLANAIGQPQFARRKWPGQGETSHIPERMLAGQSGRELP